MQLEVWDTYIERVDGKTMHFDILVPSGVKDESIVLDYGRDYLRTKSFATHHLATQHCRFCHIETATEEMALSIERKGYVIIEMENCT